MAYPLAFKVALSGAVATTAGTTGFIYREEIKTFVNKQLSKNKPSNSNKQENNEGQSKPVNSSGDSNSSSSSTSENVPSQSQHQATEQNLETETVVDNPTESKQTPETPHTESSANVSSDSETQQPQTQVTAENTINKTNYVIVKTKNIDNEVENQNLFDSTTGQQNYKCSIGEKNDDDCKIFSIEESGEEAWNNLEKVKNSSTQPTTQNLKDNTFFKLTLSDETLKDKTWDGTETVDILSTVESTKDKKYGSFTLQYKVTEEGKNISISGKTNLIVGKMTSETRTQDVDDFASLTCKIKDLETDTASSCSIFKIVTTENQTKANIEDITSAAADYTKDKFFVLDLKRNPKKEISEFNEKTIVVATNSEKTTIAEFLFTAALSDDSKPFSTSSKKPIIFRDK